MNTKIKRWTARIVGTAALPAVLALGLGVTSASAEPTAVATPAASTQHVSPAPHHYWVPVYWNSSYSQAYNWNRHHNSHHYRYNFRYYNDFYYSGHHHHVWVVYWYV